MDRGVAPYTTVAPGQIHLDWKVPDKLLICLILRYEPPDAER
jgi:hypothetical protein